MTVRSEQSATNGQFRLPPPWESYCYFLW